MKEFDKLTIEEKKKFLEWTFYYEVTMLIYSYLKLIQIQIINDNSEKNIAIETFVLHGRNLFEFYFLKERIKKDDARIFDFIPIKNLNFIKDNSFLVEYEFKEKSNKQIAHLNYTRLEYENTLKKSWDINRIMKEFILITKYFIEELSKEYKGENIMFLKELLNKNKYLNQLFV